MKLSASVALLFLTSAVFHADGAVSQHDSEVLSACASAVFEEAFSQHSGRRDRKVAHVLPEGETSKEETGRARLSRNLKGGDWERIAPALGHLQTRLDGRWVPPPGIAVPGVRIRIREPRKDDFLGYRDFFFSFWPPGYDPANEAAFVLAMFGPTPHGAEAACHLRRQGDAWVVEQKWVTSWL